ncbi:MAG: DODA-type extradiol aromatic ring-opening family dioxygenase [Pseudomonadales bacterium]
MQSDTAPALFVSHGAPDLVISDVPAKQHLVQLGKKLKSVQGIVIFSAHWQSYKLEINAEPQLHSVNDFSGFGPELSRLGLRTNAPPWLLELIHQAFHENGWTPKLRRGRGLDHGAWIPLKLMDPSAELPVVAVSMPQVNSLNRLVALGQSLAALRKQNIAVLCSGSVTHNLSALAAEGSAPPRWAQQFSNWLEEKLQRRDIDVLVHYRQLAPYATIAHPSEEHIWPLFIALGAGDDGISKILHQSYTYGSLHMGCYQFSE